MSIELVEAYKHKKEVGLLFSEYTDMLIEKDSNFKKYLEIQNYDSELEHLEDKYGRPFGRLYLVYYNRELAGCIGIRKIDDLNCEMKRLYVRPQFRGKHIGDFLIKHIIAEAKEIGYEYMLLDTLPFLKAAICMYKKYGFYEIQSYNNSPMDTSIYMKLNLRRHKMTAEEMWKQFAKEKGINDTYEAWAFCGGGEIGDELARLVLEGTKTATASAYIAYQIEKEPLPKEGCYSVILYDNGEAAGIIRTNKVSIVPFDEVSERHAYLEGEGDRSLAYWRKVHRESFTPDYAEAGQPFDEKGLCVLEEFDLVYR